jgi:hypothetical protein
MTYKIKGGLKIPQAILDKMRLERLLPAKTIAESTPSTQPTGTGSGAGGVALTPSTSTASNNGNVFKIGGLEYFKKGGMVKKKKTSSRGGSSCVGIAKRGFGKALKKSR